MITVETKDYIAKKAALLWVLKELKFLVKDVDEFIENYDDARIAVCNQLVGTDFPTKYEFKYHDLKDRIVARYIMMCGDPFEIIDLYKADYVKQSVSSTPAIGEQFPKTKEKLKEAPKKVDDNTKNMAELLKSRMNLYDPETRLGVSRLCISNVIDSLVNGDIEYDEFRFEVYSTMFSTERACQCGYSVNSKDGNCPICGSKIIKDRSFRFSKIIADKRSTNNLINAISDCLNPRTVYTTVYNENVDYIRTILECNSEYSIDENTIANIISHISRYMMGIINCHHCENRAIGINLYQKYDEANSIDEKIKSINKILKLINVKYLITKHEVDSYRIRAWR